MKQSTKENVLTCSGTVIHFPTTGHMMEKKPLFTRLFHGRKSDV